MHREPLVPGREELDPEVRGQRRDPLLTGADPLSAVIDDHTVAHPLGQRPPTHAILGLGEHTLEGAREPVAHARVLDVGRQPAVQGLLIPFRCAGGGPPLVTRQLLGGPGETSLLAALAIIRSGAHEITRLVSAEQLGPERRFVGGAQQLSERMAEQLGERVILNAFASEIAHDAEGVRVAAGSTRVRARRAVVTLPPTIAGRIRYVPALPAGRDHLTQRLPMGWVIKVHCLYPSRFWAENGLSGKVISDDGAVRATADNSPPSGSPGILVGFVEGAQARRLAAAGPEQRREEVVSALGRYFGPAAEQPLSYHERSWGDDEFVRGAYGGYWTPGVWTAYGSHLRAPIGPLHWSGTETSTAWNGKLEGAVHSGHSAAEQALERLGAPATTAG
jgi:monoamine oxidase